MKSILAAIDFSDFTPYIIKEAVRQAQAFNAKLWLLHVAAPEPSFGGYENGLLTGRDERAEELKKEHRWIEELAKTCENEGVETTSFLIIGETVATIKEESRKLEADLLVMGSHGYGVLKEIILGSVSKNLMQDLDIPVLLITKKMLEKE